GGIVGTSGARTSGDINQQRYDAGYMQCMYAKGNRVPLAGRVMENSAAGAGTQGAGAPPPPPGTPPPSLETPSTVGGP
ncbi:MAG TPA: hypothetical protein VFI43_05710, partial [Nitrosospira sp.]|nr:hypothetical protein [Nitrosospira sp.]